MQQQQLLQQQLMQQQMAGQQGGQAPAGGQTAAAGVPAALPDVMTLEQAAEFLQVEAKDVMAAIEAGDLKARKIGDSYRISKANLDAYLGG
jgi:excisionase family DNA binding protein